MSRPMGQVIQISLDIAKSLPIIRDEEAMLLVREIKEPGVYDPASARECIQPARRSLGLKKPEEARRLAP